MQDDFDKMNVGIILNAMLLQADDGEWEVLEAQHAKCAPIVRRYGQPRHFEILVALEQRMAFHVNGGFISGQATSLADETSI